MPSQDVLHLDPRDNVWIAARNLPEGTALVAGRRTIRVSAPIPMGHKIARHFDQAALGDFPTIDGVIALTHTSGCGMPFGGPQHTLLERVLRGMLGHPNIGAWLLVGLGCEQAELGRLTQPMDPVCGTTGPNLGAGTAVLSMQDCGGTRTTVTAGIEAVGRLLPVAAMARREPVPAGEIVLATQCGGSDSSSGITANPALGVASDLLVAAGGTTILGETPEILDEILAVASGKRTKSEQQGVGLEEFVPWNLGPTL